ncbi:MAG: MarR family winged helix-turn-helix transcriptional regulator [Candidatus Hermodarchaeota archaeon]
MEELSKEYEKYKQSEFLSDTFYLINKINKNFKDLHAQLIRKHNISLPQYCVMRNLGKYRSLQLKELAITCSLSRPTMTGVIDTMEKNGLVSREVNSEDRRSYLIVLTKKGKELLENLPKQEIILKNCCDALNPAEIQEINQLLVKLLISFS